LKELIKNSSKLIRIEGVVFSILLVIIFSNQFHFLWLLYDFMALGALVFYLLNNRLVLNITLTVTALYLLFFTFLSGGHIISYFAIWDNIKHLFVLFMMLILVDRHANKKRIQVFLRDLGVILSIVFFLQSIVVILQAYFGFHFDDISGTFGYGASHSLGYFCLMFLTYLILFGRSRAYFLIIFIISLLLNYISENKGFYLLLIALLFFKLAWSYSVKRLPFYIIAFSLLIYIIDSLIGGRLISPIVYAISTLSNNLMTGDISEISVSRGFLMIYAYMKGGWFGLGPGAYSDCYSLSGWLLDNLSDGRLQINISSATSCIIEYGLIGTSIWIGLYLIFLSYFFKNISIKFFVWIFFLLCFFYNKLLVDERIIFMVIFIFTFLKVAYNQRINNITK